jgi:hypothetical protein
MPLLLILILCFVFPSLHTNPTRYTPTAMNLVPLPKLKATWSKPSEPGANNVKSNGSNENNNSKPTNQEKINNNSVFNGNKSSKVAPIELESVDVDEAVNSDGEGGGGGGGGGGGESKQSSKPFASSSPLALSRGSTAAQVVSPSSKTNEYIEVEYDPAIHKFNNKKKNKKTTTNIQANEVSRDDQEFAERSPRANCLFAAGFTIPKSFIAALYSMAYYTPGFMELVEALLNPSRYDQASIPWLFKVCIVVDAFFFFFFSFFFRKCAWKFI